MNEKQHDGTAIKEKSPRKTPRILDPGSPRGRQRVAAQRKTAEVMITSLTSAHDQSAGYPIESLREHSPDTAQELEAALWRQTKFPATS